MSTFYEIPRPFLKSCQHYDSYPGKLVERSRFGIPLLKQYHDRFKARQQELKLFAPDNEFWVPYWDVSEEGEVDQKHLKNEVQLSKWLGDQFSVDPSDPSRGLARVVEVKPDPPARVIFLETASSIAPLEITASALKRVLSYYQVMPYFSEFLYLFGTRSAASGEKESARFGGFRSEKTVQDIDPAMEIPALNRSGKRYQICCTLKSTSNVPQENALGPLAETKSVWRVRSAVIYHQFDIVHGTQLWIVGDPLQAIYELTQDHIHLHDDHQHRFDTPIHSFETSLEMLRHYCRWATEEWRWRVQSVEEDLETATRKYVTRLPRPIGYRYNPLWDKNGMLAIQNSLEHLIDAVTCIESNIAIMERLRSFYTDLVEDAAWPHMDEDAGKAPGSSPTNASQWTQQDIAKSRQALRQFAGQLGEDIYDLSMQLKRANLALQIGKDRKDIFIQQLSTQNAAKQEQYTQSMYDQQHRTGLDAVAMKVITVITLFYLPMTFVSTFFSTDVVKYQPDDNNGARAGGAAAAGGDYEQVSTLALQRFLTISIPLMVVTFLCAGGWYWWETGRINKKAAKMHDEKDLDA